MAGWKKLLLGAVVVVGGVFIALILLVKIYVTPERVHDLVQSSLETSLQRKVGLGVVDVGFFSGIQLAKLSIQSKDEKDILLSAEDIKLSYDFAALLHGELLFGQILIKEPQLRLVREIDGRLNIDDLFGGQSAVAEISPSGTDTSKSGPSADIPLLVKKILLQGGSLQFIDRKLNQHSPYRYRLEDLDIEVENFSSKQPFPVRFAANLNDSPVAMELRFDLNDGLQMLKIHLDQLNLVPFLPYFQDFLPGNLGQGLLSTELQISKQTAGFVAQGQVVVDQLDVRLDLDSPIHWNEVRIALDQDLLFRFSDRVVDVKKLHVDINGVQAGYQGKILLAEPLQVAGAGSLKIIDLREISALIPFELREQIAAFGVAGSLDASMQIQGEPVTHDVIREATIKVTDLQASIGKLRPALNGTLKYAAGRIRGDQLKIDLNGQLVSVDLEAAKILSSLPDAKFQISSEKFNPDVLFPEQKERTPSVGLGNSVKGTTEKAATTQYEPSTLPANGRPGYPLSQPKQGLFLENVKGQAVLHDGKLELESLTADLAGGKAELTAEAEIAEDRIPLSGHLSVDGIDLTVLTDSLFPDAQGSISGTLVADGRFRGYGEADDFLAALNTQGNFDLRDGEIKGSPILAELSQFLTNPELQILGFSRLYGSYGLKERQGRIDAQLESRRVFFAPRGSFSLDGSLNLSLPTRISPELMAKSGVGGMGADLLKDEKGWSLLPLKVKGNYSRPRFSLDSTAFKNQLEKGVVNEFGRQLQKKLGGEADGEQNQQMQKLLDGTLKKLFGQ